MPVGTDLYKLVRADTEGITPGRDMLVEVHQAVAFSTTDSEATFTSNLTAIDGAVLTVMGTTAPLTEKDPLPAVSISSGTVTLTRDAGGTSALTYRVMLFGQMYDTN